MRLCNSPTQIYPHDVTWKPKHKSSTESDLFSDVTDALYSVYCALLPCDIMINNTVPPGHLWSPQRSDPGDLLQTCMGPSKSSFLPTFLWVWYLQESRRGFAATLAPGTRPLLPHILKLSFKRRHGNGRMLRLYGLKKHLRKKSLLFYLLL